MTRIGIIVPSCGAATLPECLDSIAALQPGPTAVIAVLSGAACEQPVPDHVSAVRARRQTGFAAAVNAGLAAIDSDVDFVAVLNDDALPASGWLRPLLKAMEDDPSLAAAQATVTDASGTLVDGRGIAFDRWGLPVQLDHGRSATEAPEQPRAIVAVSGTAALYRRAALAQAAMVAGAVFDPTFHSYHEDVDLGLRLHRLGWRASWVPGPPARHLGSVSGLRHRWRHPWWLLSNRWRALAGNLSVGALARSFPSLLRGEVRAVRTLARFNPRAPAAAVATLLYLPVILFRGWQRRTAGPRLEALPGGST